MLIVAILSLIAIIVYFYGFFLLEGGKYPEEYLGVGRENCGRMVWEKVFKETQGVIAKIVKRT